MSNNTTLSNAYNTLSTYVKRTRYGTTFNGNTLRQKLSTVRGLKRSQFGGVVNKAMRNNLIERVGTTTSNNPSHKKGTVGVYTRSFNN